MFEYFVVLSSCLVKLLLKGLNRSLLHFLLELTMIFFPFFS